MLIATSLAILQSIEMCWDKGGGKKGQGLRQQKKGKQLKKKKGKSKVHTPEEASDEEDEIPITFINFNCAALIKDRSAAAIILDMGASSHMMPHQKLLRNYHSFTQPRKI